MTDTNSQKKSEINWDESIKVLVEMVQREDSWYSKHQPLTEADYQNLMILPSGGMPAVAHMLLCEAIKREVYLSFYALKSKDELETRVFQVMTEIMKREIPRIVANLSLSGS